jgi:5'-nucleotidase
MALRVLITNDDGILAPGIRSLARAAVRDGLDVVVAAPREDASGTSAAMTAIEHDAHVVIEEQAIEDLGVPGYGVAASPGFITLIALHGAFGPPPDVVLSGVNRGANAGQAILHSGTVGAALTAASGGRRAIAVSLDTLPAAEEIAGGGLTAASSGRDDTSRHWATAARIALDLLPRLVAAPPRTVLNVNSPDRPYDRVRGVRRGSLASFGQVQMTVAATGKGFVRTALEETGRPVEPGTDVAWLTEGYASVTAIRAVSEASEVDLSDLS